MVRLLVLDTDVVSELVHRRPEPSVVVWLREHADGLLTTTTLTVAEVGHGLARLPAGRRRDEMSDAAEAVFGSMPDRVLPFDLRAASAYGPLRAEREAMGRPIGVVDAQIAAICRSRGAAVVTRNAADFQGLDLEVINPYDG